MIDGNNNTSRTKGKHITWEERIKIETLVRAKKKASYIATVVGCSLSTIYREKKRGAVIHRSTDYTELGTYSADRGQGTYIENQSKKNHGNIKADDETLKYIANKIKKGKSPDVISLKMRTEGITTLCTKTIYNLIDNGMVPGITSKHLWDKGRRKGRRRNKKVTKISVPIGKSISDREFKPEDRSEFGHWEMDLVEGCRGGSGKVLLTITERKTRMEVVAVLPNKKAKSVARALNKIERQHGADMFRKIFKTITTDNGSEFRDWERIEKSVFGRNKKRTKMYYAHPYSSWERGSNENGNRFIRRFIEKGSDIADYTKQEIQQCIDWINNYPRKVIGYKTAREYFDQEVLVA